MDEICYECKFTVTPYQPCLECVKRRWFALFLYNWENFVEFVDLRQPPISLFYKDNARVLFCFGEPDIQFSENVEISSLDGLREILQTVKIIKVVEVDEENIKFKTPLKW